MTTVEIAPDVAEEARTALAAAGVTNVEVIRGDGADGYAPNARYDRIIVTAGVWEVPEAWREQLAPDGILVVPLRMKGLTRAVALTAGGSGVWRSRSVVNCGFLPMRGRGAVPEHPLRLAEDVAVCFDDARDGDARTLADALAGRGTVAWSGVLVDRSLDVLEFHLADMEGFCRVLTGPSVVTRGLVEPLNDWGSMGVATPRALGYLTKRTKARDSYAFELGVCAYGPEATALVDRMRERIVRWRRTRDTVDGVRIEIHPLGAGPFDDALLRAEKRRSQVVVRPDRTEMTP